MPPPFGQQRAAMITHYARRCCGSLPRCAMASGSVAHLGTAPHRKERDLMNVHKGAGHRAAQEANNSEKKKEKRRRRRTGRSGRALPLPLKHRSTSQRNLTQGRCAHDHPRTPVAEHWQLHLFAASQREGGSSASCATGVKIWCWTHRMERGRLLMV